MEITVHVLLVRELKFFIKLSAFSDDIVKYCTVQYGTGINSEVPTSLLTYF